MIGEEPREPDERPTIVRRVLVFGGAFVVTAVTLGLALGLGSLGFDFRRFTQHERRMRRVLEQQPSIEQLTQGLADDGSPLLASPDSPDETARVIAELGDDRSAELREKAARWGHLRVYTASDMLYFVFFDDEGVMRDFTLVSRR